ncbi:hypothetical protein AAG570_007910 [Ranatra chinensis]|uniref:Uncharacterized protein n=1 Tax=Ranatra chinensis TaxID=642074 RepID=A0ABD0XT93_9HEMI
MASKRRNMFYQNKKQETTEIVWLGSAPLAVTWRRRVLRLPCYRLPKTWPTPRDQGPRRAFLRHPSEHHNHTPRPEHGIHCWHYKISLDLVAFSVEKPTVVPIITTF